MASLAPLRSGRKVETIKVCPEAADARLIMARERTNDGIFRYVSEIARVLKTGGRCFASCFLLNPDSLHWMEFGNPKLRFTNVFDGYRLHSLESPSHAVAIDEKLLRECFLRAGLRVSEVTYGDWCGGRELIGGLQDTIIAVKM